MLLMIGTPELIFIVLIVLLLFGGKKIPELMRGLGKGVKMFKQGMNEMEEDINKPITNQHSRQEAESLEDGQK